MALDRSTVADIGFTALVGAEDLKLHAYSAFTLLFAISGGVDPKLVRKHLASRAADTGVIAKNTWESYVKGVETAASMFDTHAPAEMAAIRDMAPEAAVDGIRQMYEALDIQSGSDIRAWATAGVFAPLDKAAAKAAKTAAAKVKAAESNASAAALFFAGKGTDSSTISDMVAAPVDPLAALAAILGRLNEADLVKAMTAVNDRMAELNKLKAVEETDIPVVADDATVAPKSGQAAQALRVAKLAA